MLSGWPKYMVQRIGETLEWKNTIPPDVVFAGPVTSIRPISE
jgi:hypothetical protein